MLRQLYHEAKDELTAMSTQLLKSTTERESYNRMGIIENEELKIRVNQLQEEIKQILERHKRDLSSNDNELNNTRNRVVELLDEKTIIENELFQLRFERKDLMNKTILMEEKINELLQDRDAMLANLTAYEGILRERMNEIERLTREKNTMDNAFL